MHDALIGLGSIVILGVSAQWLAWRMKLPSIVLLLLFGFLAGPVTGFLEPDFLFGELLSPIVSLSVAIILFEGGLSLKLADLAHIGKVVRNLLLVGVPVTWLVMTLSARYLLDFDWPLAILLGVILVVTGPTVIVPLIRSLRLPDKIGSILKWEAMLNDPLGAILAVLTFEAILGRELPLAAGNAVWGLIVTVAVGSFIGFLMAFIMIKVLQRYWVPDFLHSAFTLMMVVIALNVSNMIQPDAGLLTVTLLGIFMASQKEIAVKHIVEFKENLRVLLISGLFIILAARLELRYLANVNMQQVLFLVVLIFVARPLCVFLSTIRSGLSFPERAFLAGMAPRGIVAAAIASIFALHMEEAGNPEADQLLVMTFLSIIGTVTVYGFASPLLARMLLKAQSSPQGILIAGAHAWARGIGQVLQEEGIRVLLIDTNGGNVHAALVAGLPARHGDILSDKMQDELELVGIGRFFAMTPNAEVNALAAIHFADVFGRAETYQLASATPQEKDAEGTTKKMRGRTLFKEDMTFAALQQLFQGKAEIRKTALSKDYDYEAFKKEHGARAVLLFSVSESKEVRIVVAGAEFSPKASTKLIYLLAPESAGSNQG